jgi:Glycosyl hydrolase family 26
MSKKVLMGLALIAFLLIPATAEPDSATAAVTAYLRPDSDIQLGEWTVVGAPSAWDALNDNITEEQTPTLGDYVKKPSRQGLFVVNVETTPLKARNILSATAWFYTPTSNAVFFAANSGANTLASATFTTTGWHSLAVPLNNQAQLDNLTFGFGSHSSGEHQVSAAFLKLTLDDNPKVYWGAWMDGDVYGREGDAPWDSTTWSNFETSAGKAASIVHFGERPPWIQEHFDSATLNLVTEKGAIPLVDMANDLEWFPKHVSLEEIVEGKVDSELTRWSKEVAAYKKPFFLRWDWEMNGTWFPWSKEMMSGSNGLYANAWRHFHDIAEAAGAKNITWVWCPNTSFPEEILNFNLLYPGSAYVDWTCMDGYNRGTNPIKPEGWRSFSQIFASTYEAVLGHAPEKPVMVGEFASSEMGGSKAGWTSDALQAQVPNNFPKIKAVVWFNWNIEEEESGLRWDWPIESSPGATSAFTESISWPYYATNAYGSLPPLTKVQPLP